MSDLPFVFSLPMPEVIPSRVDNHIKRNLSALKGQFLDQGAYQKMFAESDRLIYEVYEIHRPEIAGEILMGISIVHPGKVGSEFFMTKGHFHTVIDTAEVYYCLRGEGYMVMETPEGETSVEALSPGKVLYVPPRWAHRSVCTSRQEDRRSSASFLATSSSSLMLRMFLDFISRTVFRNVSFAREVINASEDERGA